MKSAEGTVVPRAVTVVDAEKDNLSVRPAAPRPSPATGRQRPRTMEITSGAAPRGLRPGHGRRRHRRQAPPRRWVTSCRAISAVPATHTAKISGIADFQVTNPGAAIFYLDTKTAQQTLARRDRRLHQRQRHGRLRVDRHPAEEERRAGARHRRYKVQTAKETADANQKDVDELHERHEVRHARLRRDRLPRRHLPDHQHLLDAGRPAHPRDRPDAGHRLQPQAGQPVRAGRGDCCSASSARCWASAPASASPSG